MTSAITRAQQFFEALYAGQSGILELRTVPRDPASAEDRRLAASLRDFVPVSKGAVDMTRVERFLARTTSRKMAAYFGVALRTPQAATDRKGGLPYVQALTALFVDGDFKYKGEAETRRRLVEFSLPPSILVASGGGCHAYWLLREPIDLRRDLARAQSLLHRLAMSLEDVVDVSVSESARVLRIPGSMNFKEEYGEPRPVALEHL